MQILYPTQDGGIAVIHPTAEALASMTLHEIARKDVPTGRPYKIVQDEDIPSDRTFRDAWTVDEAILTDGVGA